MAAALHDAGATVMGKPQVERLQRLTDSGEIPDEVYGFFG
jgi:hypothetical protein